MARGQNKRSKLKGLGNALVSTMTWRHSFQRLFWNLRSRKATALVASFAALSCFSIAAASGQDPPANGSGAAFVEGTVRDTDGKPVAEVNVLLEEKGNSAIVIAKTNADGGFTLSFNHSGTYTVRAQKPGWNDTVVDALKLSLGDKRHVDLVLHADGSIKFESPASSPPDKASQGTMEFKDEPSFTIAGVTDWSNLGLHGSSASSQTSESLAKETLALKLSEREVKSVASAGKQYEIALGYSTKGDFARARDEVRKVLANADTAEGHRLLGELDERLHDPLEAVREYELATRMDPSEQNYFDWGSELLLHKAAEPAVEVFTRGSNAHPKSARMLTGLGAALYSSGSLEEAAKRLCDASDLQPSDPAPYLFLGKIEKTSPAALPCSEQKLARFAQAQPENASAHFYYAISLWKREKTSGSSAGWKEVETLLEKAVAIDPRFDEAYLQLGILHFGRGDFDRATREFQKAVSANPHLAEGRRQLGLLYQRTGEKAKAQQEFKVYEQIEKIDAAELERQQKELRQFLIILKDQPAASSPH
jgi:tetratricopeptide (TPR) repeat protein